MDRNQFIGFALIAAMFILYVQFFNEEPPQEQAADQARDTLVQESPNAQDQQETEYNSPELSENSSTPDSLKNLQMEATYGVFAPLMTGTEEVIQLKNDKIVAEISTKGGQFQYLELLDFDTYSGEKLVLLEGNRSKMHWNFQDNQNRSFDLHQFNYKVVKQVGDSSVLLVGETSNGGKIELTYTLPAGKYIVNQNIKFKGLQNFISASTTFGWTNRIKHQEHDVVTSRNNSNANYYTLSGDFEETSERSLTLEEEYAESPVRWFGMKQKFFTASIISDSIFNRGYVSTVVDEADSTTVKNAKITAEYTTANFFQPGGAEFRYYFGPNDYSILGDVTEGFRNNLYLGWPPVSYVNKWIIIPLFDLLSSFIGNYGLIIIVMVLLIKGVLSPLSYKSYLSMAKMRVLKPELDEIKEKHDGDMTKMQKDQMDLYRQVGVNPLSGCIPMLLQMPILFAMFYFFPQSIHLRGESFLWAEDLSTYDSIATLPFSIPVYGDHVSLFVLLMTASTILYTWSNNQVTTVQGPMKTISYIMPLIFLFVLNSFPAALSFYYFVSNIFTFGQQALIKRFVDEDKIKSILDENKKKNKNKKKSKFMNRLEEAMKSSEQQRKKKK